MKKYLIFVGVITAIVLLFCISYAMPKGAVALMNKRISITYEGKDVMFFDANKLKVYPITYNDSTYLPIRALSALFDVKIKWDGTEKAIYLGDGEISSGSVIFQKSNTNVENDDILVLSVPTYRVYYNGKLQIFEDANGDIVSPLSYEGTTYLPVRALSNLFNKSIDWNASKNEVSISNKSSTSTYDNVVSKSSGLFSVNTISSASLSMDSAQSVGSSNIGLSVGGAKDVENFRENIKDGYFPISTDITYNGLFYDYMFDINSNAESKSDDIFSPTYSTAISKDPISNQNEYYMTVGLSSNIKEEDFARKKLNLVIVLDISGSMSSYMDSYYYDAPFNAYDNPKRLTKMKAAEESLNLLLDHLNKDDRFGLVLFDSTAEIQKELTPVSKLNINKFKGDILEIAPRGGTNFEAGYKYGTALYSFIEDENTDEYENRIIVITDAMPNTGITRENSLMNMVAKNADKGIYTSFIGVGVDFNTELIEEISDVKGANYYSVHNTQEFEKRMSEEFEYMVTPLVFDLSLDIDSDFYDIQAVYGSDTKNAQKGNIMYVNTLFPSKSGGGEVKGGIVLVKLKKNGKDENGNLEVKVSYKDRSGKEHNNRQSVTFKNSNSEYYDNTGIRKGILLTRYANMMKNWILYERSNHKPIYRIMYDSGIKDCIFPPEEIFRVLGEHERTSVKLSVSSEYKENFRELKSYIESENKVLKDDTLKQEIDIIDLLLET